MKKKDLLNKAKNGNIDAFNELFSLYQSLLRGYLYRMLTDINDVNDIYHDVFIKCYTHISGFKGNHVQLKSWIFTIATNISINHLKKRARWNVNAQDVCRESLTSDRQAQSQFIEACSRSTRNHYEIAEHIDFCFTCISNTLVIEQQIALLLKDVIDLKVKEIAGILNLTEAKTKHLVRDARLAMTEIYKSRCSLINKSGTCYQCSELQGIFNPERDAVHEIRKLELAKKPERKTQAQLYKLRKEIIQSISPTESGGSELHDLLMQHMKRVNKN